MKKTLSVLLALVMTICMLTTTAMVASAAETDTQSGIEATLVTDKNTYSSGEDIKVTVNVKNTNTYDVNDVSITVELPEGLTLKSGDLSISDVDIAAGETYSKEVIAVKETSTPPTDKPADAPTDKPTGKPADTPTDKLSTGNPNTGNNGNGNATSPKTGDSSNIVLCVVLMALLVVGIFLTVKFRKKATKVLSLFLCVVMVCAIVPTGVFAAEADTGTNAVSIAIDKTVTVDAKEYIIKANIVYQITPPETYYTVKFDPNGENVENIPASQRIKAGGYIEQTEEPVRDNYIFYGWHVSPLAEAFVDNPVDLSSYPVDENITFYAIWIDCEYDADGDGLSFKEESVYNTDPFCYDSDEDGLSDYDEIVVYHTNPLLADTDSDGISDMNEVSLQLNPLEAKSDSITLDYSRVLSTTFNDVFSDMTLELTATAGALSTTKIQSYDNDIIENPKGYLSKIIDIEYSQNNDFEKASLVFDYSKLDFDGIDEDNLSFYYLNEETNSLEIVQSVVDTDNKLVITEPKHFSMYVVADRLSVTSNFSFNIRYLDNNLPVRNIANTNFDVLQHAFAFHNFQVKSMPGGFCYGFSYATYLNYIGKLPVSMEGKTGFTSYPAYDLSSVDCFFENQLYQDSQKELFKEENKYYADNVSMDASTSQTVQCIENLFFKQHNVKDKFAGSLSSNDNFSYLIDKLKADEPVMLSLIKWNGGHSVLATGILKSVNENDVYYISIYDCNKPGQNSYIKATRKWHKGSFSLQYGSYTNIRLAVVDIPESDSYVTHSPLSTGTLSGKICKASDRSTAISGATINVYKNNNLYTTQTADTTGNYSINLPAGQYYIDITAEGYINFHSYVTVSKGENTYLEAFLKVGGTDDNIETENVLSFSGDHRATVTACDKSASGTVKIPHKYNNGAVVEIGSKAFSECICKKVIIPASVATIADDAFDANTSIIIKCSLYSAAYKYAVKHNLNYELTVDTDDRTVYLEDVSYTNFARYEGNEKDSFINQIDTRCEPSGLTGTTYSHGLEAWVARWNYGDKPSWVWNEYEINGAFKTLCGVIDISSNTYNKSSYNTTIQIIGDGNVLFEENLTPASSYPVNVNVDVSNVKSLKISLFDNSETSGGTSFLLGDFRFVK